MSLKTFSQPMLPAVEAEMQQVIHQIDDPAYTVLRQMLCYHLGWEGPGAGPEAAGKRIRPLLLLLTCSALAPDQGWGAALPAAAAVELLHNFSLIHDDIEDNSPLRRGRPTIWARWGIPQAINTGDTLFTQAHLALMRLEQTCGPLLAFEALKRFDAVCLHLTQGQFLDMSYAEQPEVSPEDYWRMIGGKTAALLALCTELGALVAGAPEAQRQSSRRLGEKLGLAFQVQDDLLGIWGDSRQTGKSIESDLLEGKKSLPVLYGLAQNGDFARRWRQGPLTPAEVPGLAAQLAAEGAYDYTRQAAARLTAEARQEFSAAFAGQPDNPAVAALQELADLLLQRLS